MKISELKIGDVVYYKATNEDIDNIYDEINGIGYGIIFGEMGMGSYYGRTPIGRYLENILTAMERSFYKKIELTIIKTDPLIVNKLFEYQDNNISTYFPRFIFGRIYDSNDNIIEL